VLFTERLEELVNPMNMTTKTLALAAAFALSLPALAVAQDTFTAVDPAMATSGKKLWVSKGCQGCHAIGRKQGAPDLARVTERRSLDWLRRWLMDTKVMLETDSTAKALMAEWHGAKMPAYKLSVAEADQLVHYMAQESAKLKK
jgi:cbb3-type cytochrome oxidase cytochrome c subunit